MAQLSYAQQPPPPDLVPDGIGTWSLGHSTVLQEPALIGAVVDGMDQPPGADHTYHVTYVPDLSHIDVTVEEAKDPHWIVHDVEAYLRRRAESAQPQRLGGIPPYSCEPRSIDGEWVAYCSDGEYVWTTGTNRVARIAWQRRKLLPDRTYSTTEFNELPEGFLRACLTTFPSSLPEGLLDRDHDLAFVRAEFDRDFEYFADYLDRWRTAQNADAIPAPTEIRLHILELRHRYFGGPTAEAWERQEQEFLLLKAGTPSNETLAPQQAAERARQLLAELYGYTFQRDQYLKLKQWWDEHRNDSIETRAR